MPATRPGRSANQIFSDRIRRRAGTKLRLRRLETNCMLQIFVLNLRLTIKSVKDLYVYISVVKLIRVTQNVVLKFLGYCIFIRPCFIRTSLFPIRLQPLFLPKCNNIHPSLCQKTAINFVEFEVNVLVVEIKLQICSNKAASVQILK